MFDKHVELIIGPPGTGKTTSCLDIVDTCLERGVAPNKIGFFSFTRKAAEEATTRACERFSLAKKDFPYFRTLHSLAFKELGLSRTEVMQLKDYKRIGDALGYEFRGIHVGADGLTQHDPMGDKLFYLEQMHRVRQRPLRAEFDNTDLQDVQWLALKQLHDTLVAYKRERGLFDFSDMIDECFVELHLHTIIFDEAQDMTPQQFAFARRISKYVPNVYFAGDDMQAIYDWAGADVQQFLNAAQRKRVLPHSYRLPVAVHQMAQRIEQRVMRDYAREWTSRTAEGSVQFINELDALDISCGEWLLLARNTYLLEKYEQWVRNCGHPYMRDGRSSTDSSAVKAVVAYEHLRKGEAVEHKTAKLVQGFMSQQDVALNTDMVIAAQLNIDANVDWMHALDLLPPAEREYIRAVRRNGESLVRAPRITLSTIHGAKGGEADNTVVMSDLSSRTWQGMITNPDAEHRVQYTAMTRAKQNLYIVNPQSIRYYEV